MLKTISNLLLIGYLAASCAAYAAGNHQVHVTTLTDPLNLSPFIEYLPDPSRSITYQEILAGKHDNKWQTNKDDTLFGHDLTVRYWFRLSVTQKFAQQKTILYSPIHHSFLHELNLWITSNNITQTIEAGHLRPLANTPFGGNIFAFEMPQQESYTIIGWADNMNAAMPVLLPLELVSFESWLTIKQYHFAAIFGYYAVMISFLIYNLCIFISLRDQMYGTYLLFLLTGIITCMFIDGTITLQLFSNNAVAGYRSQGAIGIIAPVCYLIFFWTALDSFSFAPSIKKIIIALFCLAIPCTIFICVSSDVSYSSFITQAYSGVMILATIVGLARGILKKVPSSLILFTAEIGNVIGALVLLLMMQGIIAFNMAANWSLHCGMLFEVTLLSLALAERTRRAQQKAISNLQKYETLFDESQEGLFQWHFNGSYQKYNTAFVRMLGYTDKKDFNENHPKYANREQEREFFKILKENNGSLTDYEYLIPRTAFRDNIWVTLNMRLVVDENQQPLRVEGSVLNITQRKLKEDAQLAKQLIEAQNQAKSQFFASMSHELRTPLTAVLGYAEIAENKELSDFKRIEYVSTIKRAGKHLLQLINDILDLSKIEAQKLDVEILDVDPFDIVRDVEDYFLILAEKKRISFKKEFRFPLPRTIQTDPTRLKQILINICGNSVKFTERGGVTIETYFDQSTEMMCFAVKDTGIGLKPEQKSKLFGAFVQADASTTRNFGGTGLGLHLSKQIAEKLGGDITVESVYGEGSTFTVAISVGDCSHVSFINSLPTDSLDEEKLNIPQLSGKILYAEDNLQNQQLVAEFVSRTGCTIELVDNGKNALDIAKTDDFDLILTDLRMPEKDGIELTKELKAVKPNIIIIGITAEHTQSVIDEFIAAGAQAVLQKPITNRILYDVLRENLSINTTASQTLTSQTRPLRVLLAEDNPVNQQLISFHLKKAGADIVIANDGLEAICEALKDNFDLIITDVYMPILGGLEVVDLLRKKGIKIPIYALTATDTSEDQEKCIQVGCNGILFKPLNTAKIIEVLEATKAATLKEYTTDQSTSGGSVQDKLESMEPKSLLVADDSEINRNLLRDLLAPYKIKLDYAKDGNEVIIFAKNHHYDGILMDVTMPDIDGIEAARAIREFSNVPVVFFTGHSVDRYQERCKAAGGNSILNKPIDKELFWEMIEDLLLEDQLKETYVSAKKALDNTGGMIRINELHKSCKGNAAFIRLELEAFLKETIEAKSKINENLCNANRLFTAIHNLRNACNRIYASNMNDLLIRIEDHLEKNEIENAVDEIRNSNLFQKILDLETFVKEHLDQILSLPN